MYGSLRRFLRLLFGRMMLADRSAGGVLICLLAAPAIVVAAEPDGGLQASELSSQIRAVLRADLPFVRAGQSIWVEFSLVNLTDKNVPLQVPKVSVDAPVTEGMGLPLEHVFSGEKFSALLVADAKGVKYDSQVSLKPRGIVPAIELSAHASVGLRVDLTRHYESLKRPGEYLLIWRPYGGAIKSEPLKISIQPDRQASILTDFGKMKMRFYYDEAPGNVQNFIELAQKRFYDNLTFHRIISGGLVQGGDPRGDGRGIRADGKRVKAEFSKIPFDLGTVGMARSAKDPDSASCQFYICLGRQSSFDGQQTAFGYLIGDDSFETLRKIAAIPTDSGDKPQRTIYIRAISLENIPKPRHSQSDQGSSELQQDLPGSPRAVYRPSSSGQTGAKKADEPATQPADKKNG